MSDPQIERACAITVAWLDAVDENEMSSRLAERWAWYLENQPGSSPSLEELLLDMRLEIGAEIIPDEG